MKRYSIVLLVSLVLMLPVKGRAQVAGMNTLSMLQMSSSARTAALGMPYVSLYDPQDVQLGIDNASLVCEGYHRRVAVDYVGLFGGAGFGSVAVGYKFEKVPGTFLFGAHFNSYGKFEGYDEQDVYQGDFFAADYALSASWGLPIDSNFALGVSMMPILSQYESYTALAVSANVAANFVSDNRRFSATLAARNIGAQLVTFDKTTERLPFSLSAVMSYRLSNAPFTVFFGLEELTRWNMAYRDALTATPTVDPYTGEPIKEPWYSGVSDVLDEVGRHCAVGVEAHLGKAFFARAGYRYRQRAEMAANDRTNMNLSGFSYGVGLRAQRFEFAYARRNYHLGQAPNYLSLSFKW